MLHPVVPLALNVCVFQSIYCAFYRWCDTFAASFDNLFNCQILTVKLLVFIPQFQAIISSLILTVIKKKNCGFVYNALWIFCVLKYISNEILTANSSNQAWKGTKRLYKGEISKKFIVEKNIYVNIFWYLLTSMKKISSIDNMSSPSKISISHSFSAQISDVHWTLLQSLVKFDLGYQLFSPHI